MLSSIFDAALRDSPSQTRRESTHDDGDEEHPPWMVTKTEDFEGLPLPESMRAVTTHKDDVNMFQGLESWEKDPRKSLHLDQVPPGSRPE